MRSSGVHNQSRFKPDELPLHYLDASEFAVLLIALFKHGHFDEIAAAFS